jgi:FkbM family methyltransferase
MRRLGIVAFRETSVVLVPEGVGTITIRGCAESDPFIFGQLQRGEMFEPHVLAALRALIVPGSVFVDVGANIGLFSVCGGILAGRDGRVLAVEPDLANVRLLRHNLRRNGIAGATIYPVAASDHDGHGTLARSGQNAGDHRLGSRTMRDDAVDVDTRRLDGLVPAVANSTLVVKLDIQGSETAALHGMAGLFAAPSILRVIVEFWPHGLADCGSSASALAHMLDHHFDHLWILWRHRGPQATTVEELVHMSETNLAPDTEMFVDVVALRAADRAGSDAMAALASAPPG